MKIAILVAGEIRNDKIYFNELIKKYDMDVFLSSNNKFGVRHTNYKDSPLEKRFLSRGNSININELNINNLKKYNLEEMGLYNNYFNVNQSIIKLCGEKHSVIGTVYNIYHINKCLEMMFEYEKVNGEYDIIIKIRPDLYINDIEFEEVINLIKIKKNKLIFSKNTSNKFQKSDKFFLGNRSVIIDFIKKINIYRDKIWKNHYEQSTPWNLVPIGERLFNLVITEYKLDYLIFNDENTKVIRK